MKRIRSRPLALTVMILLLLATFFGSGVLAFAESPGTSCSGIVPTQHGGNDGNAVT
ncbi:MAG: hypothetical protein ACOX4P_05005 [Anaerovoracaceae bacterium]|jgi:hypothetical protein